MKAIATERIMKALTFKRPFEIGWTNDKTIGKKYEVVYEHPKYYAIINDDGLLCYLDKISEPRFFSVSEINNSNLQ